MYSFFLWAHKIFSLLNLYWRCWIFLMTLDETYSKTKPVHGVNQIFLSPFLHLLPLYGTRFWLIIKSILFHTRLKYVPDNVRECKLITVFYVFFSIFSLSLIFVSPGCGLRCIHLVDIRSWRSIVSFPSICDSTDLLSWITYFFV